MEVRIKSDSNNSRMNRIMCNKNVSAANKKDYWNPAWTTDLRMLMYSTCCSISKDHTACECKKELSHVRPSSKINSPSYASPNSSFHGVLDDTISGLNLPSNHTRRPTVLTKFHPCSNVAQFAIGFTIILRPQKEEPQMVRITALKVFSLYLVVIIFCNPYCVPKSFVVGEGR